MDASPTRPARTFRFGPFELSERDGELRKNGIRIKLQDQPFRVLLELLGSAGQVVTREELQQKLWPADTFVDFDVGLNTAIRKLRQALGDDADAPRYIETLARRGYRFVAAVQESVPESPLKQGPVVLQSREISETGASPKPTELPRSRTSTNKLSFAVAIAALIVVLAGIVFSRRHGSSSSSAHLIPEQRLTSNPEEAPIIGAVVSPDGKYVAYADSTGAYFRQIDTGETRALPVPSGKDWEPTSWYPDGTHLVLSSWSARLAGPETFAPEPNPTVWKVSILGGGPQKLLEGATSGSISPDGSQIAYFRGGAVFEPRQIWLENLSDGNPTPVLASSSPQVIPSELIWSPHGKRLAYIRRQEPDSWVIETMDIKTRAAKVLKLSNGFALGLCWGPDGRLFYGEHRPEAKNSDAYSMFAIAVDETTGEAARKEVELTEGLGIIGGASITADGKRLVLWREHTTPEVFVAEIDPATQQLGVLRRLTLDLSANFVSTWTPDSHSVVLLSDRSGAAKIYSQAIDQSVPELLTDSSNSELPRLAPDGKHFLYLVLPEDPKQQASVMKISVEGGSPTLLFRRPSLNDIQCARSPANFCLLNTSQADETLSFDAETGNPQKFPLPALADPEEWSLAPDGSTLAVILKGPKLVFVNLASKAVHEVKVKEWPQLIAVDWAADSKSVYIPSRKSNGSYVLLRVQPDGAVRVVFEGRKTPRLQWAIPAPDGRHIALQAGTGENNVWMVDRP